MWIQNKYQNLKFSQNDLLNGSCLALGSDKLIQCK